MNPPSKRLKLESSPTPPLDQHPSSSKRPEEDHCSICLQTVVDRTVVPTCSHEFCFECLLVWSEQSRRCPLCSQPLGNHLIHQIRSKYDYQKHYLAPLRTSPRLHQPRNPTNGRRPDRQWGRRERQEREEADRLDRAIARRRWIYQHDLYAKHVASNAFTRYRPCPTPAQFAASPELISRMMTFLRRELRVWVNMDVEFLTTFILSLLKSIDIRSESAVKLLAEFLDMDTEYVEGRRYVNAEHFAHEVYSYLRSPYKDLFVYDTVVQYDVPPDIDAPPEREYSRHWRPLSHSRSRSRSRSRSPQRRRSHVSRHSSRSRSLSWSPSGRQQERQRERERDWSVGGHAEIKAGHKSKHMGRDDDYTTQQKNTLDIGHRSRELSPRIIAGDRFDTRNEGQVRDGDGGGDSKRRHTGRQPESEKTEQLHDKERIDAKGKRRAHGFINNDDDDDCKRGNPSLTFDHTPASVLVPIPLPEPPIPDAIGEGDTRGAVAGTAAVAPERQKLRIPRNRNLLESVQAHLAPQPHLKKSRKQVQEYIDIKSTADSVTHTERICQDLEPEIERVPSNAEATPQLNGTDVKVPVSGTEIVARLAKLKNEVSVPKEDTETEMDAATAVINPSGAHVGQLTPSSLSSGSKAVREKLLNRLEDEKKQLLSLGPTTTVLALASHEKASDSTAGANAVSNSYAAEAKLRLRAQLRVRLAAAKRHVR